jgi:hypothetical protein
LIDGETVPMAAPQRGFGQRPPPVLSAEAAAMEMADAAIAASVSAPTREDSMEVTGMPPIPQPRQAASASTLKKAKEEVILPAIASRPPTQ